MRLPPISTSLPFSLGLARIASAARRISVCAGLLMLLFAASGAVGEEPVRTELVPLPQTPPVPEHNPLSPRKVQLGRKLFFDKRLSGDNTMSCATCHDPKQAFGDGQPVAVGAGGKHLTRNTPTVLNTAFFQNLHWDGRVSTLEEQALLPIESPDEMNQPLDKLVAELKNVPAYVEEFQRVFQDEITPERIGQALAAYERSLISGPSPLDRYLAGDESALSPAAQRGMELFTGEAGCIRCHHGPLLSDGEYYRLGVATGKEEGRAAITGKEKDRGRFRTPSLRNVRETGPYMHDGSLQTLDDVVTFYYRGVPSQSGKLPVDIEPLLGQSFTEIPDLVAFLEALSGEMKDEGGRMKEEG